jgi:hypothetical protein
VDASPSVVVLGGPNGAGKSTAAPRLLKGSLRVDEFVNADTDGSLLLCYVDHHDRAYNWAERRKVETHPATGAAQLIEIRESVREVVVPAYVPAEVATKAPVRALAGTSHDELLAYGVPPEWLDEIGEADEDGLLVLAQHPPAEAAEAILELATGGVPRSPQAEEGAAAFEYPIWIRSRIPTRSAVSAW